MPKLKGQGLEKTNKPLYDWSVFFSDANDGEAMEQVTHPDVKEAFEILKSVSATAQERLEAERRITYVRELNAIADYKWDEGMAQGIAIGEAKGRSEGRSEGKAEGRAEGKAEGKAEGRAEGQAEATRALVARQLERKFGPLTPEHQALLDSATLEQLEQYADTLLTASSLDEVFGS